MNHTWTDIFEYLIMHVVYKYVTSMAFPFVDTDR